MAVYSRPCPRGREFEGQADGAALDGGDFPAGAFRRRQNPVELALFVGRAAAQRGGRQLALHDKVGVASDWGRGLYVEWNAQAGMRVGLQREARRTDALEEGPGGVGFVGDFAPGRKIAAFGRALDPVDHRERLIGCELTGEAVVEHHQFLDQNLGLRTPPVDLEDDPIIFDVYPEFRS